jgi:hypothetical protein
MTRPASPSPPRRVLVQRPAKSRLQTPDNDAFGWFYTPQFIARHHGEETLNVGAPINAEPQPLLADADDVAAQDEHSST